METAQMGAPTSTEQSTQPQGGQDFGKNTATIEVDRQDPSRKEPRKAVPIEHPPKETKEEPKYKIVFKGKEFEEPESKIRKYINLDPDDPFDPKAHINAYQRARLYEDKLNEVERMRQEHQQEIEYMKQNFQGWMQEKVGIDPMQWAYQLLQTQEQMRQMTPEEREWYEYQQNLAAREQYIAQKEAEYQKQAREQKVNEIYQNHVQGMTKAISNLGFPMDETLLAIAADHIEAQIQKGRRNITYEDAAEWTLNKFKNSTRSVVSKLKGESLLKFLGDDVVREIRQTILSQQNGKTQSQSPGKLGIVNPQPNTNPNTMSRAEYEKYLERRMKELDGKI